MTKRRQRVGLLVTAGVSAAMLVGTAGMVAQDQVEFDLYDLHNLDPGVTFIKDTVDASTFRRLAVIDDGEPLGADSY